MDSNRGEKTGAGALPSSLRFLRSSVLDVFHLGTMLPVKRWLPFVACLC